MTPDERLLPLEGVENFRDYGGYAVPGGLQVRRGRLWRSAHHGAATELQGHGFSLGYSRKT